jgi:hypothetical protein
MSSNDLDQLLRGRTIESVIQSVDASGSDLVVIRFQGGSFLEIISGSDLGQTGAGDKGAGKLKFNSGSLTSLMT